MVTILKMRRKEVKIINVLLILSVLLITYDFIYGQDEIGTGDSTQSVEIYLIDNYVKSEREKILILSWMTDVPVKSKIEIENADTFTVSDTLSEYHQIQIDLSNYTFSREENPMKIILELHDGTIIVNEDYTFTVPLNKTHELQQTQKTTSASSTQYLYNFLGGLVLWFLPSPTLFVQNSNINFGLIKDFPLLNFGSSSAFKSFPYFYLFAGYSHYNHGNPGNAFRFGGRFLYEVENLRHFLSLGILGFTNFKGANGYAFDAGFSFLKILRTFELYTNYSYNYLPSSKQNYHTISLGLFTSSFSINMNL